LVWDPVREAVLAFGGDKVQTQTWSRAPEAAGPWRALPVSANTGGWGESAVYDTAGSAILTFGGTNGRDSVWRLASRADADWESLAVSAGPEARANAVGVYDSSERRLVIHGGVRDPLSAPVVLDDTWLLSLSGEPIWTKLTARGEGPGARRGEVGVYDPVGHRLIVFGGEKNGETLRDLHALSLGDEPEWSVLEPTSAAPELREPTAFYDGARQRMLFVSNTSFGVVVAALELGEQPVWHTFCELGTPPPADHYRKPVAMMTDALFAAVGAASYRFDLATPYCD